MELIENDDLTEEMLPELDNRTTVFAFAMSYNGYVESNSFEDCANRATEKARNTLGDIRNELFFSARASRHRGDDLFLDTYQELRPILVSMLRAKQD